MNITDDCISQLPEEILRDIFHKLPTKSIGRCRCVSKKWRNLLLNPSFIKDHLNRIKKCPDASDILIRDFAPPYFHGGSLYSLKLGHAYHLFHEITESAKEISFAATINSWDSIRASCDGLFLIEDTSQKLFLVNPTTKEIKELIDCPFDELGAGGFMYGIGYDSDSDDYKIFGVFDRHGPRLGAFYHLHQNYVMFVNVYSVKNGTWRRGVDVPVHGIFANYIGGNFVDGCIHCYTPMKISAFNLEKGVLFEVPLPSSIGTEFYHLVVVGKCLCLCSSGCNTETSMWVMKEYGVKESWTKFRIIHEEKCYCRPLCFLGEDQLLCVKNECTPSRKWFVYNLKEGTWKHLVIHGIQNENFTFGDSSVESLVSPHCSNEVGRQF